jgi:hypothetical protein
LLSFFVILESTKQIGIASNITFTASAQNLADGETPESYGLKTFSKIDSDQFNANPASVKNPQTKYSIAIATTKDNRTEIVKRISMPLQILVYLKDAERFLPGTGTTCARMTAKVIQHQGSSKSLPSFGRLIPWRADQALHRSPLFAPTRKLQRCANSW